MFPTLMSPLSTSYYGSVINSKQSWTSKYCREHVVGEATNEWLGHTDIQLIMHDQISQIGVKAHSVQGSPESKIAQSLAKTSSDGTLLMIFINIVESLLEICTKLETTGMR